MKKNFLLLFLLLCCSVYAAKAQSFDIPYNGIPSNVTVFAKEGDKFWLILNGEKQNEKPAANVKITGLTEPTYKVKVIFEDSKLPSVDATMHARDIDNLAMNVVYEVRKKAGKSTAMVMRVASATLIASQTTTNSTTTTTRPAQNGTTDYSETSSNSSTTTTTTDNFVMPAMPQVSMSIKVPGMEGGNGSISVTGGGIDHQVGFNTGNTSVNSSVTTTTTTKTNNNGVVKETYSSNTTTGKKPVTHAPPRPKAPGTAVTQPVMETPEPAVPASAKCRTPMSASAFQTQLSAIKKQSFSDTKKKTARTAISKNCLSTEQVKTILKDFSFEGDKVEMAKFAYPYTVDKENYLSVTELFSFSSSTEELTEFLDGQ